MIEYKCRGCHRFVCASDAETGRVRVTCRHCGTVQMIFLGNPDGKPLSKELRGAARSC